MLRQRSLSAIVIVGAAVIPAVLGHPILTIGIVLLASVGIVEFCRAVRASGANPSATLSVLISALIVIAVGFDASVATVSAVIVIGALALLASGILRREHVGATRDWSFAIAGIVYVSVPLAHVPLIRDVGNGDTAGWVETINGWALTTHPASGLGWLVLIVAITWLTDTAAYLGGRALGRHKLAPRLSPGKTVEGSVIGVVIGSLSGGIVVYALGLPLPVYAGFGIGLVLSTIGQIGDLAESLIKRDVGVKDMGDVIPGHGGILDRIDALLFTLPVGYYVIRFALEVNWP